MDVLTRVVVSGAAGRLGRRILARCALEADIEVAGALVRPESGLARRAVRDVLGPEAPAGLCFRGDAPDAIEAGAVLVEVAPRSAALSHVARAAEVGAPVVLASTGFDANEHRRIDAWSRAVPILVAPNLSLGVGVLQDLVARASAALPDYHLEVVEFHHARKRDAPSGTAWALAEAAASARGRDAHRDAIVARSGEVGPRGEHEVGLSAVRGGDIIGEHTVYLVGPTERIELTHRAASRDVFAAGAVRAVRFMGDRARLAGRYDMADVLGGSRVRPT